MLLKLSIFAKSALLTVILAGLLGLASCTCSDDAVDVPSWQTLSVIDQQGQSLALTDLQGKVVLMHLVFTRCMMICPVQMGQLAKIQKQLLEEYSVDDFVFVSVSATPDYDTPERMKIFAERFNLDPSNWRFVTGKPEYIAKIVSGLEAKVTKPTENGQINHTSFIYLIDQQGKLSVKAEGVPMDKALIIESIHQLLK